MGRSREQPLFIKSNTTSRGSLIEGLALPTISGPCAGIAMQEPVSHPFKYRRLAERELESTSRCFSLFTFPCSLHP